MWSDDKDKSFNSFQECLEHWEYESQLDSSIDVAEMFSFKSEVPDVRAEDESEGQLFLDSQDVNLYAHIEDLFECSGMCQPSLFYFGLPISKGYPQETCLLHLKAYLDTGAGNFAKASVLTALIYLFIFFMHFGLYCRDKNHGEDNQAQNAQ